MLALDRSNEREHHHEHRGQDEHRRLEPLRQLLPARIARGRAHDLKLGVRPAFGHRRQAYHNLRRPEGVVTHTERPLP
jgi:hypothetical protein